MKDIKGLMIPILVLALLFFLCCLNMLYINNRIDRLLHSLDEVDSLAEIENWWAVDSKTLSSMKDWETVFPYMCIFVNHSDTESVTTSFNSALSCLYSGDLEDFRSFLSELKSELTIIKEAELLTFENVL